MHTVYKYWGSKLFDLKAVIILWKYEKAPLDCVANNDFQIKTQCFILIVHAQI